MVKQKRMCGLMLSWVVMLLPFAISAQVSSMPVDRERPVVQCNVIRELVYSAHEQQFKNIMLEREKGSHGYQTRGSWRFETVQYGSHIQWKDASRSYIDNSEESTDSSAVITRQFIAEFNQPATEAEARSMFAALNRQIESCRLPLSDSNITVLKPLPPDELPESLPYGVTDAKLYPVTITAGDAAHPAQEVMIMIAMERRAKRYTVYMIVEYTLQQSMAR